MLDGRLLAFSSAMISGESPAFAASGACAYHSTCERHCRPMIRIANSLSLVGTEVSQRNSEDIQSADFMISSRAFLCPRKLIQPASPHQSAGVNDSSA